MKPLSQLWKQPLSKVSTGLVVALLIVAVLGFADATYLTVEHYRGVVPPCSIVSGCELVLTSQYSVVMGIPTALLGSIYYLIVSIGAFIFLEARLSGRVTAVHYRILKSVFWLTVAGLLASIWFIVLQAFVLKAYCLYCLGSALSSAILFVLGVYALNKNENI